MSLLYGTMKYLLTKEECPKVLVTTHFARAVELLRQQDFPNLEFVTLEFIVCSSPFPSFGD
jgi:type III secretory pathway lipoprotein EscJ